MLQSSNGKGRKTRCFWTRTNTLWDWHTQLLFLIQKWNYMFGNMTLADNTNMYICGVRLEHWDPFKSTSVQMSVTSATSDNLPPLSHVQHDHRTLPVWFVAVWVKAKCLTSYHISCLAARLDTQCFNFFQTASSLPPCCYIKRSLSLWECVFAGEKPQSWSAAEPNRPLQSGDYAKEF